MRIAHTAVNCTDVTLQKIKYHVYKSKEVTKYSVHSCYTLSLITAARITVAAFLVRL